MAQPEDDFTGSPQDPHETTPLLRNTASGEVVVKPPRWSYRPFLIFPVAFGSHAAGGIVMSTSVDLLKSLCCQWWYSIHDPGSIPQNGRIPDAMCQDPAVEILFTKVFNINALAETIGALIAFALIGKFASKYGRKPVLLSITFISILAAASLLCAVHTPTEALQIPLLVLWLITTVLSGPSSIALLSSMFVVDTTDEPAKRTAGLTLLTAIVMCALTLGYGFGGAITQWTGTGVTVFFIAITIYTLSELYILFIVPETFSPRTPRTDTVQIDDGEDTTGHKVHHILKTILGSLISLLHPFKLIIYQPEGRGWNYRLITLAFVAFSIAVGASYVPSAFLLHATTTFHMKADQIGYILSMLTLAKLLFMTFVLPLLLSLRPRFERAFPSTRASRIVEGEGSRYVTEAPSPSTKFDVLVLTLSLLLDTVTVTAVGLASTKSQLTTAMVMVSLGSGANPALQTIVTASREQAVSGDLLSAFQIIFMLGSLCAMTGLGAVLTATISTQPGIVFFLCGGFLALGALLLAFVRDSDRWNP